MTARCEKGIEVRRAPWRFKGRLASYCADARSGSDSTSNMHGRGRWCDTIRSNALAMIYAASGVDGHQISGMEAETGRRPIDLRGSRKQRLSIAAGLAWLRSKTQ